MSTNVIVIEEAAQISAPTPKALLHAPALQDLSQWIMARHAVRFSFTAFSL